MNEVTDELIRLRRLERIVAFALCALPVIFGLQTMIAVVAMPVFRAMFADFGSPLPRPTELALQLRSLWLILSIVAAILPLTVWRRKELTRSIVLAYGACGIFQFVLAQGITLAMFLPIFQLGAVANVP